MTPVFLDGGYVIALEASDDENHPAAARQWRNLRRRLPPLATPTLVFAEIVTSFNTRRRHAKAVEVGNLLLETPGVTLVTADEIVIAARLGIFATTRRQIFSLADCVSFVVMRERGISKALSFDRHFVQAGFEKLP